MEKSKIKIEDLDHIPKEFREAYQEESYRKAALKLEDNAGGEFLIIPPLFIHPEKRKSY